jgi:hypothetical protein
MTVESHILGIEYVVWSLPPLHVMFGTYMIIYFRVIMLSYGLEKFKFSISVSVTKTFL